MSFEKSGKPSVDTRPKPAAPTTSAAPTKGSVVDAATPRKPPPRRTTPSRRSGRCSAGFRMRPEAAIAAPVASPKPASQSDATPGSSARTSSA
jgi:hypothetical protein